jgi:hypothetical protein
MEVIGASDEKDLIWIRVSLAGAFICALLLAFPVIFDALLGANADRSKTPVIGKISLLIRELGTVFMSGMDSGRRILTS